jgi:hypothetical protein
VNLYLPFGEGLRGQLTPPKRAVDTDEPYNACERQKVPSKGGRGHVLGGEYGSLSAFTVNKRLPFTTGVEAIASFGRVEIGEHETRVARASQSWFSTAANSEDSKPADGDARPCYLQ